MQLEPGVAPAEAMLLDEMLVEVPDRKTLVALAVEPLHFFRPIARDPPARRLAEPAIQKPGLALLLVTARPAPERKRCGQRSKSKVWHPIEGRRRRW